MSFQFGVANLENESLVDKDEKAYFDQIVKIAYADKDARASTAIHEEKFRMKNVDVRTGKDVHVDGNDHENKKKNTKVKQVILLKV